MRIRRPLCTIFICLTLASCSSLSVKTSALKRYDWASANTYAWADDGVGLATEEYPGIDAGALNNVIRGQIRANLTQHGLGQVQSKEQADLIVTWLAGVSSKWDLHETTKILQRGRTGSAPHGPGQLGTYVVNRYPKSGRVFGR